MGLVNGAVGAFLLVPYRGRDTTIFTMRMSSVAVLVTPPLLIGGLTGWIVSMPIGATWFLSPWLVRWYVDAMGDSGSA